MRLRADKLLMMLAVSFISTMKVDSPPERLSEAPTRVKILSVRGMSAPSAGMKLPICAMSVMSAVWRSNALLPLMFGPVRMMICCVSWSRRMSLGTKASPGGRLRSITGCLPFRICSFSPSCRSGRW